MKTLALIGGLLAGGVALNHWGRWRQPRPQPPRCPHCRTILGRRLLEGHVCPERQARRDRSP